MGRSAVSACSLSVVWLAGLAFVLLTTTASGEGFERPSDEVVAEPDARAYSWYFMFGLVNAYPRLETEELVDRFFEPFLRSLAPGFGDARTVSDLRDAHLLWTPFLAVGKDVSDRWSLFFQAGYSAGKVRTNVREQSRFFTRLHVDFEIQRSAAYFGFGADYFPLGAPERGKFRSGWDGISGRLKAARPSLGARLSWTYATFDAKAKVGLTPFTHLVDLKLSDSWFLPSVNLNVGLDVPLNERSQLSFNGGYNFFWDRAFDFEGAAFTVGWKQFFR